MKTITGISTLLVISTLLFWTGCVKEGPAGRDGTNGIDGNANVKSSPWYHLADWNGQTSDWYFQVSNSNINQDIVENGVILAYASLPGDIYSAAVRPLPCWAIGANWDFLIPDYGLIEFTSDALTKPGTNGYSFRFILVPASHFFKSTANNSSAEQLRKMSYIEVCKKYNIPE